MLRILQLENLQYTKKITGLNFFFNLPLLGNRFQNLKASASILATILDPAGLGQNLILVKNLQSTIREKLHDNMNISWKNTNVENDRE